MTRRTTAKAQAKRERLFAAAIPLFAEKGFDGTTMRAIADAAGVATGAAYYYFKSKDELVLALYASTLEGDEGTLRALMDEHDEPAARVGAYVAWKLERVAPYHAAIGGLMGRMLTPRAGLSPFGPEQMSLRERDVANFARLLDGDVAAARALWTAWMGVLFFWLHDENAATRDGRAQVRFEQAAALVVGALPAMRPMLDAVIGGMWSDLLGDPRT